jgi:NAD(P)-dependent dehydrogenase (short-subunit alcohol dehydrogenase family)
MERVLVTGCSTGIGREVAIELTRKGYEVVATARDKERLADLVVAQRLCLDVTDDASVAAAVEAAGPIDVLINNAGISVWGPIETTPLDAVQSIFETNVLGVVRVTQAFLPAMRERGRGAVVNMSSAAGRTRARPILGWYSATKHALEVLTEVLRWEVGHLGIRVILIEPGAVESNFPQNRKVAGLDRPPYDEIGRRFMATVAAQRTTPYPASEVAAVVVQALAEETPRLRWYGSPDAEELIEKSLSATDEETERAMRSMLNS